MTPGIEVILLQFTSYTDGTTNKFTPEITTQRGEVSNQAYFDSIWNSPLVLRRTTGNVPFELVFKPSCEDMLGAYDYEIRYYWGGMAYPQDKFISFTGKYYIEPSEIECPVEAFVNASSGIVNMSQLFGEQDFAGYQITAEPDDEISTLFDGSNTLVITRVSEASQDIVLTDSEVGNWTLYLS